MCAWINRIKKLKVPGIKRTLGPKMGLDGDGYDGGGGGGGDVNGGACAQTAICSGYKVGIGNTAGEARVALHSHPQRDSVLRHEFGLRLHETRLPLAAPGEFTQSRVDSFAKSVIGE